MTPVGMKRDDPPAGTTRDHRRGNRHRETISVQAGGHGRVPTVFWGSETARGGPVSPGELPVNALILMGDWCGSGRNRHRANENWGVYQPAWQGGNHATRQDPRRSCQEQLWCLTHGWLMVDPFCNPFLQANEEILVVSCRIVISAYYY